jgi:hypothetical protein
MTLHRLLLLWTALAALALVAGSATARPIVQVLSFTVAGGPLDGTAQSGRYGYDTSGLAGAGAEYLALSSFEFVFNGYAFSLAGDPTATADFLDGVLLGVTYNAASATPNQSVSFQSGFADVSEQSFLYALAGVPQGGAGDPGNPIATTELPEPGPLWYAPLAGLLPWRRKGRKPPATARAPRPLAGADWRRWLGLALLGLAGCNSDYFRVDAPDEYAGKQYYVPVATRSQGSFVLSNPGEQGTIGFTSNDPARPVIGIRGCDNGGDSRAQATVAPIANGWSCTAKLVGLGQPSPNRWKVTPIVVAQPQVANETPYVIQAMDDSGAVKQTIAAGSGLSSGDPPVTLVAGVTKLVAQGATAPVTVRWRDPFTNSEPMGQSFAFGEADKWRVFKVTASFGMETTGLIKPAQVRVRGITNKYNSWSDYVRNKYWQLREEGYGSLLAEDLKVPVDGEVAFYRPVGLGQSCVQEDVRHVDSTGKTIVDGKTWNCKYFAQEATLPSGWKYVHCSQVLPAESDMPNTPICYVKLDAAGLAAITAQDPAFKDGRLNIYIRKNP